MPKTQPKPKAKSNLKIKRKAELEPQRKSLTGNKWYWVSVALIMSVFGSLYGYLMGLPTPSIALMLAAVLSVIGFAAYLKLGSSAFGGIRRAAFLVLGFSVIGFSIWALVVLFLNANGFQGQINALGENFFAITSLITCLMVGAFIGDNLGKNMDAIRGSLKRVVARVFGFKDSE